MSTHETHRPQKRRLVLGSSSPRRKTFVEQLFPDDELFIEPPADDRERDLTVLTDRSEIEAAILEIAATKAEQVAAQLAGKPYDALIAADTAVVVPASNSSWQVLSKPDPAQFPDEVRGWFEDWLLDRTHEVLTGVCVRSSDGSTRLQIVATEVDFGSATAEELDWYLSTGESLGKAGGYGFQGLGSCFIRQLRGSVSNVIGLPLRETRDLIDQLTR